MNLPIQFSVETRLDTAVFWGCVCLVIAMGLFPPHVDKTYQILHDGNRSMVSEEVTYRFLGASPDPGVSFYTRSTISYGRLLMQWLLVLIAGLAYQYFTASKEEEGTQ